MMMKVVKMLGCALLLMLAQRLAFCAGTNAAPYGQWKNGLPADPGYFPIAVWLQSPRNAERYKAAGINLYVGLWRGPTTNQLADLQKAGMPVICSQNARGLEH